MFKFLKKKQSWVTMPEDKDKKYYLELNSEFMRQFPTELKPYLVRDLRNEDEEYYYHFTDELYEGERYGYAVLMSGSRARDIQKELYKIPLILREYRGGE